MLSLMHEKIVGSVSNRMKRSVLWMLWPFMLIPQVRIVKHDRFSQGNVNVMFNFY